MIVPGSSTTELKEGYEELTHGGFCFLLLVVQPSPRISKGEVAGITPTSYQSGRWGAPFRLSRGGGSAAYSLSHYLGVVVN